MIWSIFETVETPEYAPELAPRLIAVLELSEKASKSSRSGSSGKGTHMVIVSELYGEDLLDYLDRRDRAKRSLTVTEKKGLQIACILLMSQLHHYGLAHLDFTPENILVGPMGLRLCDFAKATPLTSPRIRHVNTGVRDFNF